MIQRRLVRLAIAAGATWLLVRAMFSCTAHRHINDDKQALDETTAIAGATIGHLRGSVLRYDSPTDSVWLAE